MNTVAGLTAAVRDLIARKFAIFLISEETDLLAEGVLDSVTLVQLILSLEQTFEVRIELNELEIDDLRSARSIAGLISRLRAEDCQEGLAACAGDITASVSL